MIVDISKELDDWLIWEYPKERLKENAPKHIIEEYEKYLQAIEEYNKY